MPLKSVIAKLEDVAEGVREFYTEKNGKFELQVEGAKSAGDFDRLNTSLVNERAAHTTTKTELATVKTSLASFEGLDPSEVHQKLGEYETLKATAGQTPDAKKIEEMVAARVANEVKIKVAPLERKLNDANVELGNVKKTNEGLQGTLTQRTMDDAVRSVALEAKANPAAVQDFLALARNDLQLGEDGKTITTKDGLDLKTYMNDQKSSRPWLWPAAQGAGAGGNGVPEGFTGKNPWAKDSRNLTEQGKILQADRPQAEKLAAAAGVNVDGSPKAA